MLTRNCLAQTQDAIKSVWQQDIPVMVHVYDNESTDGTVEWIGSLPAIVDHSSGVDLGVSAGWNFGLSALFEEWKVQHVLVANNDLVLPPWLYRELLSYDVPFVTGVAVDNQEFTETPPARCPLQPNPDFSCFLIRREAWETIGEFDERMKLYASDCDYHIRGHRLGVPMMKANVPYFHASSSTLKNSSPEERSQIEQQANADRAVFQGIYGTLPGTAEYNKLFD